MKHKADWISLVILLVVVVNVLYTIRLSAEVKAKIAEVQKDKSLPCAAIPTRYILEEPECADKLLQAMNVTNVRVVARGELETRVNETQRVVTLDSPPQGGGVNKMERYKPLNINDLNNRVAIADSYNICYNHFGDVVMNTLKVTTVGNSTGVVLPREILQHLRVDKGDTLYVVETPGGIELTPYNPQFAAQMEAAEQVMREDRDVLRKLAE